MSQEKQNLCVGSDWDLREQVWQIKVVGGASAPTPSVPYLGELGSSAVGILRNMRSQSEDGISCSLCTLPFKIPSRRSTALL